MTMTLKLHTYFRSSAAYRVRIALNLKGLPYESIPVHLVRGGGEQHLPAYKAVNPAALVSALEAGGQSNPGKVSSSVVFLSSVPGVPHCGG